MSSLTGNMGFGAGTGSPMKEKIPSGYKKGSIQQFTPEMMELWRSMFGNVGPDSFTAKLAGGDQETFDQLEAPAFKQFNELQGGLASRFSGMGLGARRSSGHQNTQTAAASNFAQQLQSQRVGLRNQAVKDLMGMSSELLGHNPYENFLVEKQQKTPFWKQALGMISPIGGDIASGGTENTQNFFKAIGGF